MRYKGGNIMKYSDLISFEPIEGVIQLCEASEQDYAYKLIDNYGIDY